MATKMMKAVRAVKTADSFKVVVEDVPIPAPKAGELLIKIHAAAIQPSDIMNSQGKFGHTTFPRTIGRDFAGIVVAGSKQWEGKKVFGTSGHDFSFTKDGAIAEFAVVDKTAVATMPKNLSFEQAATLGTPWSTAYLTLHRSRAQKGETVMVLGATGSVGGAVTQIAELKGMHPITVGRHGTAVNSVEDPTLSRAMELTSGKGVDVIVDTVGDLTLLKASLGVVAEFGRLANISAPRQGSTILDVDIFQLYRKQISIIGCNSVDTAWDELTESLQDLVVGFESGELSAPDEKVWSAISIDQAVDAFAGKIKKAVVLFN